MNRYSPVKPKGSTNGRIHPWFAGCIAVSSNCARTLAGYFRYRVGDWRVIYGVDEEKRIVTTLLIVHRSKAYL